MRARIYHQENPSQRYMLSLEGKGVQMTNEDKRLIVEFIGLEWHEWESLNIDKDIETCSCG